jgi:hypothetical protein
MPAIAGAALAIALPPALAACGAADNLRPAEGRSLPVAPYGAAATPTPADLTTPDTQARPRRVDELLRSSDERESDDFDLPPG